MKNIIILGSRGIPSKHGGFETFCEEFSMYASKEFNVIVYCQVTGNNKNIIKKWRNVTLVQIFTSNFSAMQTIIFDFKSTIHSLRYKGIFFVLGYNTAIFNFLHFIFNKKIIFNMDGMEWKRKKWNWLEKLWLYINQYFAIFISTHIIADHPIIYEYFLQKKEKNKISMIPYGSHESENKLYYLSYIRKLKPYILVVSRIEPENQILEIVQAFVLSDSSYNLVIVGNLNKDNTYHNKILNLISDRIFFIGSIYNKKKLTSLRKEAILYIHGHTVGGTNPSLVEAMASKRPVVAHNNGFNRWVLGKGIFFKDVEQLSDILIEHQNNSSKFEKMGLQGFTRYKNTFTWDKILNEYIKVIRSL